MENLKKRLIEANIYYKNKNYELALKLFENLNQNMNNKKIYSKNIEFFIMRCKEFLNTSKTEKSNNKKTELVKSNIILLINPSHEHENERKFWREFIEEAQQCNLLVLDLNFRNVKPFSENITIVNPSRSYDLAKKLRIFNKFELPSWLDEEIVNVYVDWEHRRWQIRKYDYNVKLGVKNISNFIDSIILSISPSVIITSNKIDFPNQCGYLASKCYNIPYFFIERSPFDSHLIENNGMFGESNRNEVIISKFLDKGYNSLKSSEELLNILVDNPYGFRTDEAKKEEIENVNFSEETIFFLPLDNILWTTWGLEKHYQSKIDYSVYTTPTEALRNIHYAVQQLGGRLLVKPHPSCKEWLYIQDNLPEIEFVDGDLKFLIENSDVIITFLTKVAYVGLAYKKPVVSFGNGLLDGLGVTYEVKHSKDTLNVLKEALNKDFFDEKYKRYVSLIPFINSTFLNTGAELFNNLKQYIKFSNTLKKDEVSLKMNNSSLLKHQTAKLKNKTSINRPYLLFDISRLLNHNLRYSGVSRYILELVIRLQKSNIFNFIPVALPQNNDYGMSAKFFLEVENLIGENILNVEDGFRIAEESNLKYIYHSPISAHFIKKRSDKNIPIITVHDIFHLTRPEHYQVKNHITSEIVKNIKPDETNIIFVSAFSQKEFVNYLGNDIESKKVIHLGVSKEFSIYDNSLVGNDKLEFIEPILQKNEKFIVIPYQDDPRKGFKRMMDVGFRWMQEDSQNRKIIIFGSTSRNLKCLEAIQHMDTSNIYYLADPNDNELAKVYSYAMCHLYFSEAEGFGLPPLEAMASGCPSIMFNNTSLSEVYSGYSLLIDENVNDLEIINILTTMATNRKHFNQKKLEALEFSKKYTWEKTYINTLAFYNKLLNKED